MNATFRATDSEAFLRKRALTGGNGRRGGRRPAHRDVWGSSDRSAGAAGVCAAAIRGGAGDRRSGSVCPRSSAGCWRSAGSGSTMRRCFLAPRLRDQLPDPSHLRDMDAPSARLVRAVRDGETIAVFGDYDVDGATSAALLTRFFAAVGASCRVYVPDRLREGYGPNARGAAAAARRGRCGVVVTVDCGTTAHQPLAEAAGMRARRHRRRSSCRRAAAAARVAALVNPNRLDEDEPAWRARRGRRRLPARRRGQPRAARGRLVRRRPRRARPARNGSISWRSARCAMSCR